MESINNDNDNDNDNDDDDGNMDCNDQDSTGITPTPFDNIIQHPSTHSHESKFSLTQEESQVIQTITICAITWNLHGKSATVPDIEYLIPKDKQFDIYAIGTEECERSILASFFYTDKSAWEQCIQDVLGDDYIMIKTQTLSAIHLIIMVKKSLLQDISCISSTYVKTGLYNWAGNKGAVAIWFKYREASFIFINCHLAAGHTNSLKRNEDVIRILNNLDINNSSEMNFSQNSSIEMLNDFDCAIFMGDMNYRIEKDSQFVRECLEQNKWAELVKYDQMLIEIREGRLQLFDFKEGDVVFLPTYKFEEKTDNYAIAEGDRVPGWTDRILYKIKASDKFHAVQVFYTSIKEVTFSDHKPVMTVFEAKIIPAAKKISF